MMTYDIRDFSREMATTEQIVSTILLDINLSYMKGTGGEDLPMSVN